MSENSIKPDNSYTEGPIMKKMLIFALPIITISFILQLFNTFDMAVAGRFISKEALAAIGSTSTISGFFIEFFLGFSTASNVIIAQLLGKVTSQKVTRAVKTAVVFALYSGIFIAVCSFVTARYILNLMSVPDNILTGATQYLKIYFTGMSFFMLYNFCSAICRSQNYGARKFKKLNKIMLLAIFPCEVVSIILTTVTFIFSNSLLRIFLTDSTVIALALTRMKYTLLFKPIQAVMDIMTGCLQGYGYTLIPAIVSVFGVCGIRLLWIYTVFPKAPGMDMLMVIYPITQTIAAVIHSVCYIRLKKHIVKNTYVKL